MTITLPPYFFFEPEQVYQEPAPIDFAQDPAEDISIFILNGVTNAVKFILMNFAEIEGTKTTPDDAPGGFFGFLDMNELVFFSNFLSPIELISHREKAEISPPENP